MTARIHIVTLGTFQIQTAQSPVLDLPLDWNAPLLALLLFHLAQPVVQPGELLATLADGNDWAAAGNRLRTMGIPLVVDAAHVRLQDTDTLTMDCVEFERLVSSVLGSHSQPSFPVALIHRLESALAFYHGEFLAGAVLEEDHPLRGWVDGQRRHYHQLACDTAAAITEHYMQNGNLLRAVEFAVRWLELDSANEAVRQRVAHLLKLGSRRLESMAPVTGNSSLALSMPSPAEMAPPPASSIPFHDNIPAPLTPIVGREDEIQMLRRLVLDPAARLVTMYGLSGIGKSRCVQETLHQMAAEGVLAVPFPHGVWYVRMESIAGPGEAAGVIAGSLRAPIRSTGMEHGLVDYLRPRSLLLWLDGFDGMGPAIPLLRRLLQTAPGLKLLVTSHEKLLLEGEKTFELRGLATASPDGVAPGPAELLFLQHVRPGNGRLSAEEMQALHKICTAVDGHPLGLILTATASQYFTFSQIAHELNRGLSLFSATQRDIPPRHRTFHALFQNSWRLWSSEDRALALQLAVFHEGFTLAGAVDVSNVPPARIGELVDRGVIERVVAGDPTGMADESIRYRLHPIVFPFVRDMLFAQPELLIPLRERHAMHIARFVRRQTLHLGTAAAARGLDALALEWPNLVAAWRYGVQMQRVAILAEMTEGLFAYLVNRGPYSDGVRLTNLAIDWLRSATELPHDAVKGQQLIASLYAGLATLHSRRADFGAALEAAKLALAMEQRVGDLRVRALAQLELGRAYFWTAHYREAAPALEEARILAKQLDDPRHKIRTDATVASLMIFSGDHQKGAALFMQTLAHAQSGGYVIEEAQVLAGLATVSYYAGRYAVCEELSARAEGLYQALGDLSGVANCVMNRANVLQQVGRFEEAQEGYLRALAVSRKTEDVAREVMMLANLGLNAYHRHEQRLALDYLTQAANLANGSDMRDFQAFIALCRGHVLTALHEHADALQWYESALALRRALGQRQQTAEPLAGLIELSLQMGDQRVAGQLAGDLYQLVSKPDFQAAVELFRVYWACFAGLRAVADEHARDVLEMAYRRLESRAAQIGDEAMRRDFYTRVEAHRNILAAWGSLQSDVAP